MKLAALCPAHALEKFASTALTAKGIDVDYHRDAPSLIAALRTQDYEGVLLEDNDEQIGHWLASLSVRTGQNIPLIVVGVGDALGISRALQHGADDYAVMSEGTETLIQRIHARVRSRSERKHASHLQAGPYSLHAATQILANQESEVSLTAREFALAWALFENLGRVVTLKTLSTEIWGRSGDIGKRTIEQHVYKLRRKLCTEAPGTTTGPRIQTVYGVGYRMHL